MHQDTLLATENPFGLVAEPKYLYRSASHGTVLDQLQEAIRKRDGIVLVTGDVGSGKTTVCRAVLAQVDSKTFTSLILDPSMSQEDLLRVVLQDFGLVSRDQMRRGRLGHASKAELLGTLRDFLASLRPIGAAALLVIDEGQDIALETLDEISALAGPPGSREKLLQIVLVGTPILEDLLTSPLVSQLDGRIVTRLRIKPLTADETSEYVSHRLMVAGARPLADFAPAALPVIHRYSGGVPRLVNMLCAGAMLLVEGKGTNSITPRVVEAAAAKLELKPIRSRARSPWSRKSGMLAAAGVILATLTAAYVATGDRTSEVPALAAAPSSASPSAPVPAAAAVTSPAPAAGSRPETTLPPTTGSAAAADGRFSVLVASFRQADEATALMNDLRARGLPVREIRVVQSPRGVWHQVLVGPYPDAAAAARGQERVRQIRGYADARVISG
jgi:general secretion pathway protein A